MSFRFRKSVRMMPGVRVNFSHRGIPQAGSPTPVEHTAASVLFVSTVALLMVAGLVLMLMR
jgi:Protein of unknown function (DUF4236)